MINIEEFKKVEIMVGTVVGAEGVEGSEKLIKLSVECGEEDLRTILTGMKIWHKPEYFLNKQILFVANLEPRPMMGFISEGMILAVDGSDGTPVLLTVEKQIQNGSKVR